MDTKFEYFQTMSELFLALCRKIFDRIVKTEFYLSRGSNYFFSKINRFLVFFRHRAEKKGLHQKKIQSVCHNCILRDQKNILRMINLVEKFFSFIFRHWTKNFCGGKSCRGCQKCMPRVYRNILRNNGFFEIVICSDHFWKLSRNFAAFLQIFLTGLSKLNSTSPQEHFEWKCSFSKTLGFWNK